MQTTDATAFQRPLYSWSRRSSAAARPTAPGTTAVRAGGPTMGQFREELAAKKLKTARQKVLAAPEADHASAMAEVFGENAKKLPAFPTPPYESPMQIEVPEKALTDQWRLGAWHLKRWCRPTTKP